MKTGRSAAACLLILSGLVLGPPVSAEAIERTFDVAPGGRLVVDTDVGSVRVTGADGSAVKVRVDFGRDELRDELRFDFEQTADGVRIEAVRKNRLRVFRGTVEFDITVPYRTDLDVDTAGGAIEVENVEGSSRLDTSGGPIRVRSVQGDVDADTSGGGIEISDVRGDVDADTSGGGIEIEDVQGAVNADTSGGPIHVRNVSGDIVADTSGGGIEIEGAGGRVQADTSGGAIEVVFAPGNHQGGRMSTSGGGIRVVVDASAPLDIDAQSSAGTVKCQLPIRLQGSTSKSRLRGTVNGGGAELRLRASGGGIRIETWGG